MAAKQLSQAITNSKCEVPKVIGSNYDSLSNGSTLFKLTTDFPGEVIYSNNEIMIVIYETPHGPLIDSFETPLVKNCSSLYATKLRFKMPIGSRFQKGDILYEYDCFNEGIPTYGYNLMTAYMSFWGYNHEDSIVLSETAVEKCKATKSETILIPIYTHSLYNMNAFPNKFGFIPDIGESINGNIVAYKSQLKSGKNILQQLSNMNITNFATAVDNYISFNTQEIRSRISNGKIMDIRIHIMNSSNKRNIIDKTLQNAISKLTNQYSAKISEMMDDLKSILSADYIKQLLSQNYVLIKKSGLNDFDKKELVYLIELQIVGESPTFIGDKMTNRYANKGVVSLILPDELRPIAAYSNKPIDSIVGPISVISRMNFGQIIELLIGKGISKAEDEILKDNSKATYYLEAMAKISDSLNDKKYSQQIRNLNSTMNDVDNLNQLMASIKNLGLYFEAPNFANFELNDLMNTVESNFDTKITEPVILPKKLFKYMNEILELKMPIPKHDVVLPNILTGPIYTIKLKQIAKMRSVARDFGAYRALKKASCIVIYMKYSVNSGEV